MKVSFISILLLSICFIIYIQFPFATHLRFEIFGCFAYLWKLLKNRINALTAYDISYRNIALICMAAATIVSAYTTFYLYRWRRIVTQQNEIVVPEKFGLWVETIKKDRSITDQWLKSILIEQNNSNLDVATNLKELSDVYKTFHKALENREAELKRFKEGYDIFVYKQYLRKLISIVEASRDAESECPNIKSVRQVRELADFLLDDCGVVSFAPQIGSLYRESEGVSDDPKLINTDDRLKDGAIESVIKVGYKINREAAENDVLIPAKVAVYNFKNN
jgi:hypothetical protein